MRNEGNTYNRRDPDGIARWKATVPLVLQRAIVATFHGGATQAQRALVMAWVTSRVHGASVDRLDLLRAHLADT